MDNQENKVLVNQYSKTLESVHKVWGWLLALGVSLIILGILAIGAATFTTILTVLILGVVLIVGGIIQIAYSFWANKWSGFFLTLLAGIVYLIVGLLFMTKPIQGALGITLLLAAFYTVSGLFRMVGAAMARFEHWGWVFFSGLISFILGLLIWAEWPSAALWILGLFVGIDLLFVGWAWVILSLSARTYDPLNKNRLP